MAIRSLGRNRLFQRRVLLVPDETSASGWRRLPLGSASRGPAASAAEPLRHAPRTIPADRGIVRAAFRAPAARIGSRAVLGNKLLLSGVRPHSSRLHAAADFFRLPVLGRDPHRAMVAAHRRKWIFSAVAARNHGKAAGGIARLPYSTQLARSAGMFSGGVVEPGCD